MSLTTDICEMKQLYVMLTEHSLQFTLLIEGLYWKQQEWCNTLIPHQGQPTYP